MRSIAPEARALARATRSGLARATACIALAGASVAAIATPVTVTPLTGITGGAVAGTAVYKADLSGLGLLTIQSLTILDNSVGLGGAPGTFSGFDLDAVKLSTTDCATAACAASAVGLSVFDFVSGTFFVPGAQRAPVDPKLFGTDASGAAVDDAVATLGAFDGESSTLTPFGFLSLGDNGRISFNFTSAVSTAGLFLYFGEVGNNGEVAASSITVNENRVPEPGTLALAGLALAGLAGGRRRGRQAAARRAGA